MKTKKQKIRELLYKISPKDRTDIQLADLKDKIKETDKKFQTIPNYDNPINSLRVSLYKLADVVSKKFDNLPNVEEIQKNFLSVLKEMEIKMNSLSENMQNDVLGLNSEFAGSQISTDEELKKLDESIQKFRLEFLNRLSHLGGGSMNRKITFAGIDYLTRYTDINYIGNGVTFSSANDNVLKRVNVTLTSSGGSTGSIISATDSGDHQNYILSSTLTSSTFFALINNGIYTTGDTAFPFMASGTSLTFTSPLPTDLANTQIFIICI